MSPTVITSSIRVRRNLKRSLSFLAVASLALTACGGDSEPIGSITLTSDPADDTGEPDVAIPDELPTELVITDITEGTGEAAKDGDTVYVYYVGVLSKDGTRFDGNFGQDPFPVTLGLGMVISGWDQGLIGAKAGGRRQLDIPADLAYGEQGAGEAIGPNEALSFVVDVVGIVPAIDATNEPTNELEARDAVTSVATNDLVDGSGDEAAEGDTVVVHLVAYRADTGERLQSTWESPQPLNLTLTSGATLDGFVQGIAGMKVGGRREITVPFALAFGDEGNAELGLPEKTDLVVIVDLFAAF
ncbi:MAG: FKBP-type peptidyl-prolyl cis-trans isomerase [Actinomycetota bacterium]